MLTATLHPLKGLEIISVLDADVKYKTRISCIISSPYVGKIDLIPAHIYVDNLYLLLHTKRQSMTHNLDSYRRLTLRNQAQVVNNWLRIRLDTLLPEIMHREGFDMWIIAAREYNEDPVIMSFLPAPAMSARRRTILVFVKQSDGSIKRLTLSRYAYEGFYTPAWDPDKEDQHECLARIIREYNPQTIGLNTSLDFAFGDGLTHIEYRLITDALGEPYISRIRSAERLCLGWLERRIPDEMTVYPRLAEMGHAIIAEAFSSQVIHPGITTTDDLVWWMCQRMQEAGLEAWFQPSIDIQAPKQSYQDSQNLRNIIMPGDLLHCDIGFYYLGLATDQQQHAYVLKATETDAPKGLKAALQDGNRLQDIHMEEMIVGKTGNEVLRSALNRANSEGIRPQIYSHPLGYHGHAAGPTIGLWDQQDGVPGRGDYELFDDTAYSIELNIVKSVPEWQDQDVRIMLEEDALLTGDAMQWLDGRQENFYLIG